MDSRGGSHRKVDRSFEAHIYHARNLTKSLRFKFYILLIYVYNFIINLIKFIL